MKDPEFFRRALAEPSFRREMLAEHRYRAKVDRGFLIVGVIALVGFTAYWIWRGEDWVSSVVGLGAVIILSLASAMHTSARVAALEAIDERESGVKTLARESAP